MFCRKCGAKLIEDSLFCPKCGTKVEGVESVGVPPSKEDPPASPEPKKKETKLDSTAGAESSPLMFSPDEIKSGETSSTAAPPMSREKPAPAEKAEEKAASEKKSEEKSAEAKEPEAKKEVLPASLLPKPDGFGEKTVVEPPEKERKRLEKERKRLEKERKRSKKRWHPLDSYNTLSDRSRYSGCALLIILVVVIPLLVLGFLGWSEHKHFVNEEGFESVFQENANVIEAPEEKSLLWNWKLWQGFLYEAEETEAEIAIMGGTWWLEGTFREKVYFRGYQLILEEGAKFEGGLDVKAVYFDPGTAEIEGELTGNIAIQK